MAKKRRWEQDIGQKCVIMFENVCGGSGLARVWLRKTQIRKITAQAQKNEQKHKSKHSKHKYADDVAVLARERADSSELEWVFKG